MTRCAYAGCQAGGDILERAPRYITWSGDEYHPGCWAAEKLVIGTAIGRAIDHLVPHTEPAAMLVVPA